MNDQDGASVSLKSMSKSKRSMGHKSLGGQQQDEAVDQGYGIEAEVD